MKNAVAVNQSQHFSFFISMIIFYLTILIGEETACPSSQ